MNTQTSDTITAQNAAVALTGDEALVREWTALFESSGMTVIDGADSRALAAESNRLQAAFELTVLSREEKRPRLEAFERLVPAHVPLLTSSICVTALTQSRWVQHPERLIGFAGFPTLSQAPLVDLAPTIHTSEDAVRAARSFFTALGKETVCVQDRTGMIAPAVICQMINEALMTVQQNVSSAQEIDTAMKLGAGFPLGPIEWGEKIGFAYVEALLDACRMETGEERWRTAPLLRQLAAAGSFWKHPIASSVAAEAVQEELPLDAAKSDEANAAHSSAKKTKKTKKSEK
ncbi:MAG: 3-hydroxyacyl-CoA dehydrogenase family protein [Acidobacteriota bacterium]